MAQTKTYTRKLLQPYDPSRARSEVFQLPGHLTLSAGQVLGVITGSGVASEVQRFTITGSPTGGTFTLVYGTEFQVGPIAYNADAAAFQAAFEAASQIGVGNVTGSGAGPFDLTFGGDLQKKRLPLPTLVNALTGGSSPSVTIARQTAGHPGTGKLVAPYNDALSDGTQVAKYLLMHDTRTLFDGSVVTERGYAVDTGVECWVLGEFFCADLVGLDDNAVADLGRLIMGAARTEANAVLSVR